MRDRPRTAYPPCRSQASWRGDLSPLGREAALKNGTAAQSNGDKSPRHKSRLLQFLIFSGL
ncbi:hypothetical protein DJ564_25305 [Pseudomonas sp. 31-12]|nr:hypothetical protein DJ564_25305 [Pseudomonas sp. 31-12]